MTRLAWRIATDTRHYEADDLSGTGAERSGGRWNEAGVPMVYAASNRALACLETIVHLNAGGLPFNRYLVEIAVPDVLWDEAIATSPEMLPVGWEALPAGRASMTFGTRWATARTSALLIVPSAIVPEESNILLNPRHPDARHVVARKIRRWTYDPRLTSDPPGRQGQ
ncbi:RES family NAD+ phosphorylase [Rhizorhabdus sp. FW153]|uniref:RES family NAD+ phosphorylase n=1 Tax=Rhizorhabdus sp. FW153 TaxID=3400216 RepID=UPI003CE88E20